MLDQAIMHITVEELKACLRLIDLKTKEDRYKD